jgi:hypothetical protein
MVGRAMSCSSSESSHSASPPFMYSPLPTPTLPEMIPEMTITKIEELEDDDNAALMRAPPLPPQGPNGEPIKRGRGRPRKHPVQPPKAVQKVTKGRSKTGCITCRRRKKKCDETKPECMFSSFEHSAGCPLTTARQQLRQKLGCLSGVSREDSLAAWQAQKRR